VLDAAGDRPVVFRTVDVGGDKALPYMRDDGLVEENPALGWRAIRLALDRDGLMKAQARALLAAAAGRQLNVMFPMISEPWEFDEAKALFERQKIWLSEHNRKLPSSVLYGAMLEVPGIAEVLDILLPKVDFLSIGTNDLTQFLFAADRAHPKLAERYDWVSPIVLRFIARVSREARAANVPVAVCGEMGGRTIEAMALIGIGIDRLSITPAAVGPIKAMVCSLDIGKWRQQLAEWLAKPPENMRNKIEEWARANGVWLGEQ
jgi:phosphotransferase system enzyme I (PtsP)